jgi:hypothetical protein
VNHRVDDRFANSDWRNAPSLAAADATDLRPVQSVFLDECDRVFDRSDQVRVDLGTVRDPTLVDTMESSSLDPGIWKVLLAVLAKEKNAAKPSEHFGSDES